MATVLVAFVFPVPSVFTDVPAWLTFVVTPAYMGLALALGTFWVTRRIVRSLRWAIEQRTPDRTDQRNTFVAPWRVAKMLLVLWGVGAALLTTLYGQYDTAFIPRFLFAVGFSGVVVATAVLPDHRVRAAARRRPGTGSRSPAPSAHRGHHGPDHDRVVARFGRAGNRYRDDRSVRTVTTEHDRDPIRFCRTEFGGSQPSSSASS